ncbi:MAG: hypothetical protein ACRC0L_04710, partial [Angustibacter sp.]
MSAESFPSLADILADDALLDALAARTDPLARDEDAEIVTLFKAYIEQAEGDSVPAFSPAPRVASWPGDFPQQRTMRTVTVSRRVAAVLCLALFPLSGGAAWVAMTGAGDSGWSGPAGAASSPSPGVLGGEPANDQVAPDIILSADLAEY